MPRLTLPRIRPLSRKEWISASIVGGLVLAYVIALQVLDSRAETYFRETRSSDPELYLEQLRDLHGFKAFLPEYTALEGFENYSARAPEFLIGRWTMRDAPIRQTAGVYPEQCSDHITFDYGAILMIEPEGAPLRVVYKIKDGAVVAHSAGNEDLVITPVSFGSLVDHLEFTPPGRDEMIYAYICRR